MNKPTIPVDIRRKRAGALRTRDALPPADTSLIDALSNGDVSRAVSGWRTTRNRLFLLDAYRAYREHRRDVPEDVLTALDMIVSDLLNAENETALVTAVVGRRRKGSKLGRAALEVGYNNIDMLIRFVHLTDKKRGAHKLNQIEAYALIAKETGREAGGVATSIKEWRREAKLQKMATE